MEARANGPRRAMADDDTFREILAGVDQVVTLPKLQMGNSFHLVSLTAKRSYYVLMSNKQAALRVIFAF